MEGGNDERSAGKKNIDESKVGRKVKGTWVGGWIDGWIQRREFQKRKIAKVASIKKLKQEEKVRKNIRIHSKKLK